MKEAPPWVNGIIDPVNSFMESTYQALNKNLNLGENVASFVKEIIYITPSTYPSGVENTEFLNQLKSKAIGVLPLQVFERQVYLPPPGPVYIPWIENEGSIIVYPITGLEADKTYLIRLVIF